MEFVNWCRLQWDRALAVVSGIAGVLLVVLGWIGVSDTPYIAKQVPYVVSYGIGGLVLVIIGATLWLSADMNDEWRTLDRLEGAGRSSGDGTVDKAEIAALTQRVRDLEARTELTRTH